MSRNNVTRLLSILFFLTLASALSGCGPDDGPETPSVALDLLVVNHSDTPQDVNVTARAEGAAGDGCCFEQSITALSRRCVALRSVVEASPGKTVTVGISYMRQSVAVPVDDLQRVTLGDTRAQCVVQVLADGAVALMCTPTETWEVTSPLQCAPSTPTGR